MAHGAPTETSLQLDSAVFRCAVLRRLGLPVAAFRAPCEGCGRELDAEGFHRTTCMRTGRVHARHKVLVTTWRRVFREAGHNIPDRNVEHLMCTTHIRRSADDARRMDLVTPGLPGVFGGAPLFMDATCVSPLTGEGRPKPRAAGEDGAAVAEAERKNREEDHPDVEASPHACLLSLGAETYGRWSPHSQELVAQLARKKARGVPDLLRRTTDRAYTVRWWSLLAVALQRAVAESVLRESGADLMPAEGSVELPLVDVLDACRA